MVHCKSPLQIGQFSNELSNIFRLLAYFCTFQGAFLVSVLICNWQLYAYLLDIDIKAKEKYDLLMKQFSERQNITDQLKAENQMLWVQMMNNIANQARKIVNSKIIYM